MPKIFVFYNGAEPSKDPNPLRMEAETQEQALDKIAMQFGHSNHKEFRAMLDRENIRIFNKEHVGIVENYA